MSALASRTIALSAAAVPAVTPSSTPSSVADSVVAAAPITRLPPALRSAEAERFVKSSRENINQQNIDNYNITASSEEHFKERSISKLKTTNENYGRGSIVKANDYQIRFITKPKLFHRGGAYLIDIESIEEITLVPENYGKLLKIISNLSIPGTYCFTLLVNIWSETAHIQALVMTMIPLAAKGLLSFAQGKRNTIKMSHWDEAAKIVYFEDLLSKQ